MQSKIAKKVLSGILSVSLMLQMSIPVAYAEESNSTQETKTITTPMGTLEEELLLPKNVAATVGHTVYEEETVVKESVDSLEKQVYSLDKVGELATGSNTKTVNHLKITSSDGNFETSTDNGGLITITSSGSYTLSMDGAASSSTGILVAAEKGTVNLILDGITVETANECLKAKDTNYKDKNRLQVIVDLNGKANSLTYTGSADLEKYFGTAVLTNMEVTDSKSGGSLAINGGLYAEGRKAPYGNIKFKKGRITIDPKGNFIGINGDPSHFGEMSIDGADVIIPREVYSPQTGKVFTSTGIPINAGSFTWEGAEIGNLSTTRGVMLLTLNGGTVTVGKLSTKSHGINGGVLNGDVADGGIKIQGGRINGSVTDYTKIQLPYQEGEKISIENTFFGTQDWNTADSEKTDGKITLWIRNGYDQKITIGSTAYEYKWDVVTSSFRSTTDATVKIISDLSYNAALPQGYTNPPKFSITAEKTDLAQSTDTITYQWYENSKKIPSATEASYTIPIGKVAGEYTYYCDVTCGDYSIYSGIATVKIVDAVAGVVIDGNNSYYDNLNSAFAAVPKGEKSTITLLKDIDLGTSSVPDHNMKGDITLNLNGKTLSSSGSNGVIAPYGSQSYPLTITGAGTISYSEENNLGGAITYFSSAPHRKLTIEDNVQIVTTKSRVVYLGGGADLHIKGNAKLITSNGSTVVFAQDVGSNIIIDGGTLQNDTAKKIIFVRDGNVVINKPGVIMKEGSIEAPNIYFNAANDGVSTTGNTWYRINTDAIQNAVNNNKIEFIAGDNTPKYDNLLYGKKDETVSFTVTAKAGYVISDIASVTKGSTPLSVEKTQGDYTSLQNTCTFSFTMPSDDGVAVSVPVKLENCLTLVGESISRVYDGTAFELPTIKGKYFTWSGTGTANIDGYYTDNTGSTQTNETNSGATTNGGAPKNAGTYYAKVSVSADNDYAATTAYVPFTITQSDTTFDGGIKTYKDNTETNTFNYGDTITVKVAPKATGTKPATNGLKMARSFSAPTANQMALFVGNKQITEPVNATNDIYTMTYDTSEKDLVIGDNIITAKYVGNSNMADYNENVTVTLNKKAITSAVVNTSDASASKEYDGTNSFTNVALTTLIGVKSSDTVTATASGTVTDVNVGTGKSFTATSIILDGDHKDYYNLAATDVSGNVSITQATITGVNQEMQVVNGLEKEYSFDLTKLLPALFEGKSFGDITYTVGTVTNTDKVLAQNPTDGDIKNGKITLKVAKVSDKDKTATIQIKVASKNYKEFTVDLNVKTIDKIPLNVEAVFSGGMYNGKPYAYTGTPIFKDGTEAVSGITYTAKYIGRDGTTYDKSENAPTNAGKYNLILTVSGESVNTYVGTTTIGFEITKKQIMAKPNDMSIKSNASFPTFTWSIDTGIIGETITSINAESVEMEAQENNTKLKAVKVGTFDIVFTTAPIFNQSGNTEKNYDIQIGKGKLAVTKHNSGGGSSGGGSSSNSTASNLSANLPKTTIDKLVKEEEKELCINSGVVTMNLDIETLQTIQKEIGADVNVSAKKVDNSTLSAEAKAVVGNRPVFDLTITGTNGKKVTDFGKGKISVSIPYTLGEKEKAENVIAYYIDNDGKVHEMPNSVYNEKRKTLSFVTYHFSKFAVGYKEDTTMISTTTTFKDIANHWAKDDIEFVTARGIFSGTGEGKFSPNMSMTRGMFVTVLGKLAKAEVSGYKDSGFADVKIDTYYMPYIEWANKNGIVNGISVTNFAPDQSITREQMAVIMANYSKTIGFELPQVNKENTFADNAKISSYAKTAVKQMQMAGILAGKDNNRFDPQGIATRAEVSAVLKCFVELVEKK
ncbi:S-layer homology domain-containing protein [Inediibacterium massiliense]|uniref:S-layer homology domain-containing protein n=1 Tax=Inediibacterium massiliense TaxID=1658111 RepID=UPI0006B60736|nr:S-layer homology domain-containing protein [Inediibacterium massiliense]